MINEFQKIGLHTREIAMLLLVPETTLQSWFTRSTLVPMKYYQFIAGLNIYQAKHENEDLKIVSAEWETDNRSLLETQKTTALRELNLALARSSFALEKLRRKETRLLKRLHLAKNYPKYLNTDLQKEEHLISWCNLILRSSKRDLGNLRLSIQKLESKTAAVIAQIQYWDGQ